MDSENDWVIYNIELQISLIRQQIDQLEGMIPITEYHEKSIKARLAEMNKALTVWEERKKEYLSRLGVKK